MRNSGPGVFNFNQHAMVRHRRANADLAAVWHRLESVGNQVDGMTDELITELGQISDLRVISRTSAMTYKGTHRNLPQIAQELNVDAVVEGAVLRSGSQGSNHGTVDHGSR